MYNTEEKSICLKGRLYMKKQYNVILCISTLGIFWVVCKLSRSVEMFLKTRRCEKLSDADCVFLKDNFNGYEEIFFVEKIAVRKSAGLIRYNHCGFVLSISTPYGRFIFDTIQNRYVLPKYRVPSEVNLNEIYERSMNMNPIDEECDIYERSIIYGRNLFGIQPVSIWQIVINNVVNGMFIWELLPICVWIMMRYYCYAIVIGGISSCIFCMKIINEVKQRNEFCKMNGRSDIRVLRYGRFVRESEEHIYPGDVIAIDVTDTFKCDALIIKGDVVIDESFLTGESVSICKGVGKNVYSGTNVMKSTCLLEEDKAIDGNKSNENSTINYSGSKETIGMTNNFLRAKLNNFTKRIPETNIQASSLICPNDIELPENFSKANTVYNHKSSIGKDFNIGLSTDSRQDLESDKISLSENTLARNLKLNSLINENKNISHDNKRDMNAIANSYDKVNMEKLVRVRNLYQKDVPIKNRNEWGETAIGLVVKTGQRTKRGILFKNLVSKKEIVNKFTHESFCVIIGLLIVTIGVCVPLWFYLKRFMSGLDSFLYAIDIGLTVFNPALNFCQELSIQHVKKELCRLGVRTVDITRINKAGEIDIVVFDKTGTLTEIDVDIKQLDTLRERKAQLCEFTYVEKLAFSTCHSVLELDGKYSGDILDMKMMLMSQASIVNRNGRRYIALSTHGKYVQLCREEESEKSDIRMFFDLPSVSFDERSNKFDRDNISLKKDGNSIDIKETFFEQSDDKKIHGKENENDSMFCEVLRIYDFESKLKRMSVVVKDSTGEIYLFCKGAPDSLLGFYRDTPSGYNERVNEYALQGYRVLALGFRRLDEPTHRTADERDLIFIGFIIFANPVKAETFRTIGELNSSGIRNKMCTGDNILTSISVARECGMIPQKIPVLFPVVEDNASLGNKGQWCRAAGNDRMFDMVQWYCVADDDYIFDKVRLTLYSEFENTESDFIVACEAKEYEHLKSRQQLGFILDKGVIFARFDPENKKALVEDFCAAGKNVMFCGDGANDISALSAADVSLSLAENEASLVASFSARTLFSAVEIIKEGRSAIAMAAAQFKYCFYFQVLSGVQMVVLIIFRHFLSDIMSLWSDIVSVFILNYALTNFLPANVIHPRPYKINLFNEVLWLSIELLGIGFLFTLFILYFNRNSNAELITTNNTANNLNIISSDGVLKVSKNATLLFFICFFLCLTKVFCLADYKVYRQSRQTNPKFIFSFICAVVIVFGLLGLYFANVKYVIDLFGFVVFPSIKEKFIFLFFSFITILFTLILQFISSRFMDGKSV